jgi:polar amino acid transport system permease protein
LVFALAVCLTLAGSEGWSKVSEAFFSPQYFVQALPEVLVGLLTNLLILLFATLGVALWGTLIALLRTTVSSVLFPLRLFVMAYTDIFRGMPMIIVLYLIGFGIPGLRIFGRIDASLLGTIAIILVYSAYVAEVIRAGIEAVHPSQRAAARSLGRTHAQTMRMVILPQSIRRLIPPVGNEFIMVLKDASLVSMIALIDITKATRNIESSTRSALVYIPAMILYLIITAVFTFIFHKLEKKYSVYI